MKFSVLIPTYDSAATLERLLESLKAQTHGDYEVIVVDDASTDGTGELVARYPFRYEKLERNQGPAAARNRGAELAAGDWYVFTDADTVFEPDTLQTIERVLEGSDAAAMFGSYSRIPANQGFMPRYKALWEHYAIDMIFEREKREMYPCNTWLPRPGVVRRDAFDKTEGFDPCFRGADLEDVEFGYRLQDAGYPIYFVPAVHIRHHYPVSLAAGLRRFSRRCVLWMRMAARRRKMDVAGDGSPGQAFVHILGFGTFWLFAAGALWGPLSLPGAAGGPLLLAAAGGLGLHTFLHRGFLALAFREEGLGFAALSFPVYWVHTLVIGFAGGYGFLTAPLSGSKGEAAD